MSHLLSVTLLQPDTYIYIGWGGMLFLSLIAGIVCWRTRRRWLRLLLLIPLLFCWFVFLWGTYVGFAQFEVVRVEFAHKDIPAAFDGYKIVQFGDVHSGTFSGSRQKLLRRAVDSINAQHADAVVFTGDLQNIEPDEILEHKDILGSIKAKDGVFSVLGNHDYAMYTDPDKDATARALLMCKTVEIQEDMGWTLLANTRKILYRDSARLVIAGMENDGEGRFPQMGDINSALYGTTRKDFVVMLEHDPTSWQRKILPHCHAQLTLSGHTHGGQFSLFGLSPAMFTYKQYHGWYRQGDRALYVTKGLGGVVPFRFNAKPEIVVITLKSINE